MLNRFRVDCVILTSLLAALNGARAVSLTVGDLAERARYELKTIKARLQSPELEDELSRAGLQLAGVPIGHSVFHGTTHLYLSPAEIAA